MKGKYGEKANFCYMDTASFIVYIKTENIYIDIAKYNEIIFDTSNYELEKSLPKGKNEVIELTKYESTWKIKTEFAVLRSKI